MTICTWLLLIAAPFRHSWSLIAKMSCLMNLSTECKFNLKATFGPLHQIPLKVVTFRQYAYSYA